MQHDNENDTYTNGSTTPLPPMGEWEVVDIFVHLLKEALKKVNYSDFKQDYNLYGFVECMRNDFKMTIDETMEMAMKWNYGRLGTTIWRECNRVLRDKSIRSPKAFLIAVNTVCPIVIMSWRDNWERLTEYFQYTPMIRKLIYTTNIVEGYHRQVRKVTKNKGVFPTDTALEKLVFLAYRNIQKKWTMPLANWGQISQQLAIKFGDRFKLL